MGSHKLKHVRILLLRHNAGAGSIGVRQVHKAKVLAGEQAAVGRELANRLSQAGIGKSHLAFYPSPAHLGIDGIVGQVLEAQQFGGAFALEGGR